MAGLTHHIQYEARFDAESYYTYLRYYVKKATRGTTAYAYVDDIRSDLMLQVMQCLAKKEHRGGDIRHYIARVLKFETYRAIRRYSSIIKPTADMIRRGEDYLPSNSTIHIEDINVKDVSTPDHTNNYESSDVVDRILNVVQTCDKNGLIASRIGGETLHEAGRRLNLSSECIRIRISKSRAYVKKVLEHEGIM